MANHVQLDCTDPPPGATKVELAAAAAEAGAGFRLRASLVFACILIVSIGRP